MTEKIFGLLAVSVAHEFSTHSLGSDALPRLIRDEALVLESGRVREIALIASRSCAKKRGAITQGQPSVPMKKINKKPAASKQARLKQKSSNAIFGFARATTKKAERLFPILTKDDFALLALGIDGEHVSARQHRRAEEMKIAGRILEVIISEGKVAHAASQAGKRLGRMQSRCANTYTWFVVRAGDHLGSGKKTGKKKSEVIARIAAKMPELHAPPLKERIKKPRSEIEIAHDRAMSTKKQLLKANAPGQVQLMADHLVDGITQEVSSREKKANPCDKEAA